MTSKEPITFVIVAITFLQFPLLDTGVAGRIGDHAASHVMMESGQDSASVTIHRLVMEGNIV